MRAVMVDTDILSYYLKGDKDVIERFSQYLDFYPSIKFSIISYYEILSGLKYKGALKQIRIFELFCMESEILPLTIRSSQIAANAYSDLREQGLTVDDMDLLIGSIAIENDLLLITNNTRHFEKIPGLMLDNWKVI